MGHRLWSIYGDHLCHRRGHEHHDSKGHSRWYYHTTHTSQSHGGHGGFFGKKPSTRLKIWVLGQFFIHFFFSFFTVHVARIGGLDDQYDHDHDQTGSVAWTQKKEPKCSARPSGTVALDCELPMVSGNPCTGLGRAYSAVWENNMAKNQMKVSPKVRPCWFCRVL